MRYFDLHCDTLFECDKNSVGLKNNGLHVDLVKATVGPYIQCFAAWIPDTLRGDAAFNHFEKLAKILKCESETGNILFIKSQEDVVFTEKSNKIGGILTIEGGAAFGGKLENIQKAAKMGVKMVTLTWNKSNEIGSGIGSDNSSIGLTCFGKNAIAEMEKNNIIVDISHASEKLFYDVCEAADKPFVASHSNSKHICNHKRNLSDEQFFEIKNRGGLVGINFYKAFLTDNPDKASVESIFEHADYFMSLGGENILAMGSDFDGSDIPNDMTGISSIEKLSEIFRKHNYSEELIDKIFYKNAKDFMLKSYKFG